MLALCRKMRRNVGAGVPRRTPAPEDRQRAAERSCRLLIEAALDVFAEKGYAGARIQDIADRAGLNKQLISYYFGGKSGLYRELQRVWREREATFAEGDLPLEDLASRYLDDELSEPNWIRLVSWRGLTTTSDQLLQEERVSVDLSGMTKRQTSGEVAADLNAGVLRLALVALVAAPVSLPHMVWRILGHTRQGRIRMKALVVYDSVHGNTREIAESIAQGLSTSAKTLHASEVNPQELKGLDLLVIGSPTQGRRPTETV